MMSSPSSPTSSSSSTEPAVAEAATADGPSRAPPPRPRRGCGSLLLLRCLRWGILHGGLTLLFAVWMALCVVKVVHDDYFLAIVGRARRTDTDLMQEHTYYERRCSVADLTATTPGGATDLIIASDTPIPAAVDKLMRHGALMVPSILRDETIRNLRRFVVAKNAAVRGTPAQYPVSQGRNRIFYGIEATEDAAVVQALQEIHDHPSLRRILQWVTGDVDPSLTEITAITASYGCSHQGWHSDVKSDGNGVKFGRTYSHSYSLFVPLQDTTELMGPTDLCAGTHYCSDPDLAQICDTHRIGVHQVGGGRAINATTTAVGGTAGESGGDVWRAGDGFLLNQQVWHRGSAHRAKDAPERVVFIVSFLGRPHRQDHVRQLSRGTYFHMKYNMWGHTLTDLKAGARWMGRPWNLLRCMHLWKPPGHNFGYDLFTSAAMRIANSQLGCEPEDLERFLHVMDRVGIFPQFLDGTIDLEHPEAWEMYFRETIRNYVQFFMMLNLVGLSAYALIVVMVVLWKRHPRRSATSSSAPDGAVKKNDRSGWHLLWDGMRPLAKSHGIVLAWTAYTLYTIHSSPWARDITSGRTLMRPFPNVTLTDFARLNNRTEEDDGRSGHSVRDDGERGLTTLPSRLDVLVGTRMSSRTVGSYASWYDYHPGNSDFIGYVTQFGGRPFRRLLRLEAELALYDTRTTAASTRLSPVPLTRLVHQAAIDLIERRGARFLLQDYRTGDWLVMTPKQRDGYVHLMLAAGTFSLLAALKQEMDFLLDRSRFGFELRRCGPLKGLSERHIHDLWGAIFTVAGIASNPGGAQATTDVVTTSSSKRGTPAWMVPPASATKALPDNMTKSDRRELLEKAFYLLQEVVYVPPTDGEPEDVTIIGLSKQTSHDGSGRATFDVAFYGTSSQDMGSILEGVSGDDLVDNPPVTEGDQILADYRSRGEYHPGVVTRVLPSDRIHVAYDDGDVEYFVPMERYGRPLAE